MPKYKVQFELRTEGLDAPEDLLICPIWEVAERNSWINLTEIITVNIEAESALEARNAIKEEYHKAFDIYVWNVG